ncbi:helix-turn-helix domain-containing protein [Pseudanabaena sp. FACHB-2040]|uniref:helix-turn-helix domain-containing protein n=1 Tax=Pseudanabaena sp. FACHB-2040 TaxID=2692859 RepID=UPI0016820284|nr:helix-turn-helix domain-containing protein [Pseudanabaena sp. FACHB-2040]MBD2256506.1 PAS domain S-box protein [Pseudanabaena sp. FACHB-2040]
MNIDRFSEQVSSLTQRLNLMLNGDESFSCADPEVTAAAFKELGIAVEELQVAVEELQQQNDSLAYAVETANVERGRYEHLFRFAPQAYLVTNLKGEVLEANLMASQLLGVPPEYLAKKPLVVYVDAADRPKFWTELMRRQERDYYQEWELGLASRNANVTVAACSTVAIRDRTGQPVGFQWALRDITHRKRLQRWQSNKQETASSPAELLLKDRPLQSFSRGEIIPLQPQSLGYVSEGLVKLTTLTDHNKEVLLGLMGPGTPFGRLLTALPLHEVMALSDVQVAFIDLDELLIAPELTHHLFVGTAHRLQQTELLLAISGEPNAEKRLRQMLEFLKVEVGEAVDQGIRLSIRLTHEDLASACCTTRVTITRLLGKLQQEGSVLLDDKSHLVLLDS